MQQRSPIIVWLLVAATICVNLVAYAWMRGTSILSVGTIVYVALLWGQLSVICIWSALQSTFNIWSRIAPVAAVIACSSAFWLIEDVTAKIKDILPYFGLHAVILVAALWVLRRSAYWQRRSGVKTEWRFSIAQLLVLMTVVAILATAMRHSSLLEESRVLEFFLLSGSVALAVTSVIIWSRDIHWLLRLAGVLATAIGLGASFYLADEYMLKFAVSDFLTQAILLSAWLAWGQILPIKIQADVSENAS
jgi:hypothetical protein